VLLGPLPVLEKTKGVSSLEERLEILWRDLRALSKVILHLGPGVSTRGLPGAPMSSQGPPRFPNQKQIEG
jgi:hypothetical protein